MPRIALKSRPFFLSVGPQRAGTSWLDRYFRARGDVCLPDGVKEIFFFDRHYHKGKDFYESHFKIKKNHKLAIEFTTTAFDDPETPQRVKDFFDCEIKFLCPLRDPVSRSYSLYRHYKRYGLVRGSLQEACADQPQILTSSYYVEHLTRWFALFPPEHIHIFFQEELDDDQNSYVKNINTFLEIPHFPVPDELSAKYNSTTKPRSSTLASLAQSGADLLRHYGLYGPINLAKAIGLKPLIFGKEGRKGDEAVMNDDERAFLLEKLGNEREKLCALMLKVYNRDVRDLIS